jgi:hypothetical protein
VKAVEKQNDAVEVVFTRPLETLDYVSARVVSHGATVLNVEARGPGAPPRKLDIPSPGDEAAHNFRLSLPPNAGKGYDRVRIAAPTAHRLSVEEAKTCRQPEDLLK